MGCAVGAVASGDCGSGAAGGVIGETVGLFTKARLANWLEERVEDARSGEVTTEQLLQELNEYQDAGVDVARLVSGFAVAVAGGDVDAAALTGGNAAENNALCAGICIGIIAAIAGYVTYLGDGDPLDGLAVFGSGDHPLSHAMAAAVSTTVEWSASKYPDETEAFLGILEVAGDAIDAKIEYLDDATGNKVSQHWNEIPEYTRNQIKGGVGIISIFVPGGSVKALKQLKAAKAGKGKKYDTDRRVDYPPLARPNANSQGNVILGDLDDLGRPTGVISTITRDMIGTGSSANPTIRPPGFEGGANNHARGHLLANILGGSGNDARNLVTLFQRNANSPNMRHFENQVRNAVDGGQVVNYRAIPIYSGNNSVPIGVTLTARGSGGFDLDVSIQNINGLGQ